MSESTPSQFAHRNLRDRCTRLAKFLELREGGEAVPLEIVDEAAVMVREAVARWLSERQSEQN